MLAEDGGLPVALLAEGVGRNNCVCFVDIDSTAVALLAEGVGRNTRSSRAWRPTRRVALLAEGVGRNANVDRVIMGKTVALLAEGVGRNIASPVAVVIGVESPSSRRAWVEI